MTTRSLTEFAPTAPLPASELEHLAIVHHLELTQPVPDGFPRGGASVGARPAAPEAPKLYASPARAPRLSSFLPASRRSRANKAKAAGQRGSRGLGSEPRCQARRSGGAEPVRVVYSVSGSGTTPILIDVPLELRGSNAMEEDDFGWPTGVIASGTETLVKVVPGLTANMQNMIRVIADQVTVANLSLDANTSNQRGIQLALRRAQDFTVSGNRVTGQSFIGINPKASSGKIIGNYITNVGAGTGIGAGNASFPAKVLFSGNRSVANSFAGSEVAAASDSEAGSAGDVLDSLSVTISENDLSNNTAMPGFSSGLRFFVIRRDPPYPTGQSSGMMTAVISENNIMNNWFGVSIDAGFPYRTFQGTPDLRQYTGSLDLGFEGNQASGNVQSAIISFERNTATLHSVQMDPTKRPTSYKYLQSASYDIRYDDGSLDGYWFDHPVVDPIDRRILNNHLIVNGVEMRPPVRTAPVLP
jgi:hypothetical protein